MISLGGDADPRYRSPMDPTDKEREFLEPYRRAWYDDDDIHREPGVRLENPDQAEDEYNGLEDEPDAWWDGWDRIKTGDQGDLADAYGIMPSEIFYRKKGVRL